MTPSANKKRSEAVRERRSSNSPARKTPRKPGASTRQAYRSEVLLPVDPRTRRTFRQAQEGNLRSSSTGKVVRGRVVNRMGNAPQTSRRKANRNGSDFAFNIGGTAIHAPALALPTLGPRWISAGLTLLLGIVLYTMATANTFKVSAAEVTGNQRLDAAEVSTALGVRGQPIYKVVPAQLENNLRLAFPDLAGVSVQVGFPNHIRVNVMERTPVLAWYQDGSTTWIDSTGVAFMPRGSVQGLIQIASNGAPPKMPLDPSSPLVDQPFIPGSLVQAIITLYPQVPNGSPMIYDSKYGIGWQDPRGWSVYFGQNTGDISMKQKVYQAILDTISQQGIQPTLISVEYLDAPFYK